MCRRLWRSGLIPPVTIFAVAFALLMPAALSVPQHGDEAQYIWSASYYGDKIAHLDFRPDSSSSSLDPGWEPMSYWNLTQPMGSRLVYALAMAVTHAPAPPARTHYSPDLSSPDELVAPQTLLATRFAAVTCAALGFALLGLRLGWRGLAVALSMLAFPEFRSDLARAWAEGPLLLGLSLAFTTFGSPWFSPAAGLAATFKLTALLLWPVVFLTTSLGRSRIRHVLSICLTAAVWTLLTPASWFNYGPHYLVSMLLTRRLEYAQSTAVMGGPLGGMYVPSRYVWPFALLMLVLMAHGFPRLWAWFQRQLTGTSVNGHLRGMISRSA